MTNRYKFLNLLGEGGAGAVFKAWDNRLQRAVAVKRLLPVHEREGSGVGTDLGKEASTLAAFQHPNVVSVYDLDYLGDEPCIVMEYLNGETIQQILQRGALTMQDFMAAAIQSLEAMEAAHQLGIQHRDVKPSNFMIQWSTGGNFLLKMVDFGIAEMAHRSPQVLDDENVYGSVHYLAPEQFSNGTVDARADLYSLGCVLYSCITAEHPFLGETLVDVRDAHLHDRVNPALAARPGVPDEVKAFILKLMALEPKNRYQTATAAREAFSAIAGKQTATTFKRPNSISNANEASHERDKETITQKLKRLPVSQRLLYGGITAAALIGLTAAAITHSSSPIQTSAKAPILPLGENLHLHLDANTITQRETNASVRTWKDQAITGGLTNAEIQFSEARNENLPIFHPAKARYGIAEGTPTVRFDNGRFLLPSPSGSDCPKITLAALLRTKSAAQGIVFSMVTNEGTGWELTSGDGNYQLTQKSTSTASAQVAIDPDLSDDQYLDTFKLLICEIDQASGQATLSLHTLDDRSVSQASVTGAALAARPHAFALGGPMLEASRARGFAGDIAEFVLYDTHLPANDRSALVRYFQQRYAENWGK